MKKDSVKRQWDKAAEAWVDFVRTGKDYSRFEMNNPAMFKLLGDIRGKKILDLACGEGYNSRIMASKRARVTGVDFSRGLIGFAIEQEKKDKLGIDYFISDASDLSGFKNDSFDIVTCFMALQDIKDYKAAIKEICRVMKKKGRFVFVIPHPCFEGRIINGKRINGWVFKKGTKTKSNQNALYYKIDKYFVRNRYMIDWNMKRLTINFKTTSFHRTLTDYADALYGAGLAITRILEPKPTRRGLVKYPFHFERNLRVPDSIVIEAVKC